MERINWTEKITNMEVLKSMEVSKTIIDTIVKSRNLVGHVMRGNKLFRENTEGRMLGKKGLGRIHSMQMYPSYSLITVNFRQIHFTPDIR